MKKLIIVLCFIFSVNLPLFAASNTDSNDKKLHPITLTNKTNKEIAYVMAGMFGGAVYGIKSKGSDVYHSKPGDDNIQIEVGQCKVPVQGDHCTSYENIKDCTGGQHYNGNKIKFVRIKSLNSCRVICTDDTSTSCKV